jgi:SAM-dependent methyltransferase
VIKSTAKRERSGIVHRVEDGMDRRDLVATTYQMRNFYKDLATGWVDPLQVMNYLQHHTIATQVRGWVLDVCCGRGLLLPLLRYYGKQVKGYVGVDIEPRNATFLSRRVTDDKPLLELGETLASYYAFPVRFVESAVSTMHHVPSLHGQRFQSIVYTSSIEHMQKREGELSLVACRALAVPGARLWLTCPNTPPERDGYETRYRAHIYEWKLDELQTALQAAHWQVLETWGVSIGLTKLKALMTEHGLGSQYAHIRARVAGPWLAPVLAALYPAHSDEVGLLVEAI